MSGLTSAPGAKAKHAVIIDGVVDRIVTWDGIWPIGQVGREKA